MDNYRWHALATYNAERDRGLLHTPQWHAAMAIEQEAFNAEQDEARRARGGHEIEPGVWVFTTPARFWHRLNGGKHKGV